MRPPAASARARLGIALAALAAMATSAGWAQEAIEDESKVPAYVLPDPLVLAGGRKVTDARTWSEKRRLADADWRQYLAFADRHLRGR